MPFPALETTHYVESPDSLLKTARQLECQCDESCVDVYFQAALAAWDSITASGITCHDGPAWATYHKALKRMVLAGPRYGRLDPRCQLQVFTEQGPVSIPVFHRGFVWQDSDFDCLLDPCCFQSEDLDCYYRCDGLGVPLIVIRKKPCNYVECEFHRGEVPFSATVVLRRGANGIQLEFFDPLRIKMTQVGADTIQLATDISATLAWSLGSDEADSTPEALRGFILPRQATEDGLYMLEPFQPGKIPLVFVHGLLSDPLAFVNPANELRADPEFVRTYQIWYVQYSTGDDFLASAADLRQELQRAVYCYDPLGADAAICNMVLAGHSMGGLLCRLLVSRSCGDVWRAYSRRPVNKIRASETLRAEIVRQTYFEPLPFVRRVIFIGVPHNGSQRGPVQELRRQFLSAQVRQKPEEIREFRQLKWSNPFAFRLPVIRRLPTSVDMMSPRSPLIPEIQKLPINPNVCLHTVYAVKPSLIPLRSDGLVSVNSARSVPSHTELKICDRHIGMQENPITIAEIRRILGDNLRSSGL